MRALLIEDDVMIGQGLVEALGDAGITADWVLNGADGAAAIGDKGYAFALLDLTLPEQSGMDILQHLRRNKNDIPVIIISARDGIEDRLAGLDCGADDYLVKPFDSRELISRIFALIRRQSGHATSRVGNGEVEIDLATHEAEFDGISTILPQREFSLLQALLENPGMIWSRARLEERLYGWNQEVDSNAVEVLIHSLRKRLGKGVIQNVRGAGWKVKAAIK